MSTTYKELWAALVQNQVQLPGNALLPAATLAAEATFNSQASALIKGLNSQSSANGTELVVANAVWTNNTPILPQYAADMLRLYAAGVNAVTNAAPINAWASDVTRGLIKQAVPANLKFSTVLTNAVYFKGAWQYAFSKRSTRKQPFTTPSKASATVDMMRRTFKSYEGDDTPGARPVVYTEVEGQYRAIKLPYKGGNISAIAVLPNESRYGLNADAALAAIGFDKLLDPKAWRQLSFDLPVSLPKFTVKVDMLSLSEALSAMGVKAAFDRRADFTGISSKPLVISDVLQSVQVIVDEAGTTAAAVTSVVMVATSIMITETPEPLVFDRPFIFALVDDSTQALLFLGTVKDPSKQ